MAASTPQEQMAAMLGKCGIPAKEIKCYGSQIMVTAWSDDAARKWFRLLQQFTSTVRGPVRSMDYCKVNKNTVMIPSAVDVWRVWGTI